MEDKVEFWREQAALGESNAYRGWTQTDADWWVGGSGDLKTV